MNVAASTAAAAAAVVVIAAHIHLEVRSLPCRLWLEVMQTIRLYITEEREKKIKLIYFHNE